MKKPYNQRSSGPKAQNKLYIFDSMDSVKDLRDHIARGDLYSEDTRNRFLTKVDATSDDINLSTDEELDASEADILVKPRAANNKGFSVTHNDVADYFLAFANQAEELITNMKIQKLVYYAQAWYLANYWKPLFFADFEAWVHGPVIPDLYHEYKKFGYKPIIKDVSLKDTSRKFRELESEFLDEVIEVYMPCGAYELERMAHLEKPWIEARVGYEPDEVCHVVIPKPAMREYYAKKLKADSAN